MQQDRVMQSTKSEQLVINWHVTEVCNYSCRYCFAHWSEGKRSRELLHDRAATRKLISELATFFTPRNQANPLSDRFAWSGVRLNIAGGEPLLYSPEVLMLAVDARSMGLDVSIITNGSLLTPDLVEQLAPLLSVLGVSVDASRAAPNRAIGREDRKGRQLDLAQLADLLDLARRVNPALEVKVNSVVNAANVDEDLSGIFRSLRPDKWKVLRVLPVISDVLAISGEDFRRFTSRHAAARGQMFAEDNNDMTDSYIMIDPQGRFFQNRVKTGEHGHLRSPPILRAGVAKAFQALTFDPRKFASRYAGATNR